jgi:Tfp pilus assembly protein PilX
VRLAKRARDRADRGGVLVLVLIMVVLIGSLVTVAVLGAKSQAGVGAQDRELAAGLSAADNALARAKARLLWEFKSNYANQSPALKSMQAGDRFDPWTPTGGVALPNSEGASVAIQCLKRTASYIDFQIEATSPQGAGSATGGRAVRRRAMIVMRVNLIFTTQPTTAPGLGAIVAFGGVEVSGNFNVDGRDHPADATSYTDTNGPGAPGITATGTVTMSGSSAVGGNNQAPEGKKDATEGTNYDSGTTSWNPETGANASDGIDNDGDGLVDETSQSTPTSADAYFGKAPGSLKAAAQSTGTYFTTAADYNAWVATQNALPATTARPKVVVYLEVSNGTTVGQFDLPVNPAPTSEPMILVVAGATATTHDTKIGPVHANNGTFQGVLMADFIDKMNGNGQIVGQVVSFNTTAAGTIGNGTFDVLLSTEVLGNLPGTTTSGNPASVVDEVLLWREMPPP